jgi:hypothetical protein
MNKREFLLGSAERSATVREYIKANGMQLASEPTGNWQPKGVPAPSTTESKLASATDEEIDALYVALGIEYAESSAEVVVAKQVAKVEDEVLADEIHEEFTSNKGESVPVIMVAFVERTKSRNRKSRNFKFALKNGMEVIVNPYDNLIKLGLKAGDLFPINPDTIVYTQQEGYLFAKPNFSHPIFDDINTAREDFADEMEEWETDMRLQGVSQKEINAQRTEQALKNTPMPKLKGFKFKSRS